MRKEFRIYYGDTLATRKQLDAIEEIVVEQEIGRIWEARIKIPVCINEEGTWCCEDDHNYKENARVRIEARIGEGEFIPLIDGRITDQDPGLNASPGSSMLTLTVRDDTTLLHRVASSESFPGMSASEIARSLFETAKLGGMITIDETSAPSNPNVMVQRRNTSMQLLRSFMFRHRDFYAYVLPGSEPGTSDCFFTRLPVSLDPTLPDLILTGAESNISRFDIRRISDRSSVHEGASLNMDDMSITSARASSADIEPPGGEVASLVGSADIRSRRLPPGISDQTNLQEAADGAALDSSFTVQAEGEVLPQCYSAILSPYRMIRAKISNCLYSGKYVIFKVTHTLGISEYTQSFSLRGNTVTPSAGNGASGPAAAASIGGAASVSFNIQMDIF